MVICVTGDVVPEKVFEAVEEGIETSGDRQEIQRVFPEEPEKVCAQYVEQKLAVATPLFQMGFKDCKIIRGPEMVKRETAMGILLGMMIGRSSELYERLYDEGLIHNSISYDYNIEKGYSFSMMGGESKEPEKVRDIILDSIEKITGKGIDKSGFERIRKALKGRFIKSFNSIENISNDFIGVYFNGNNLFDYLDVYDKISFEYTDSLFREHFNPDKLVLSVIKPI
jgi:predicted Zn-dependent peptidase